MMWLQLKDEVRINYDFFPIDLMDQWFLFVLLCRFVGNKRFFQMAYNIL